MKKSLTVISFIAFAGAALFGIAEYLNYVEPVMNWVKKRFGGILGNYNSGQVDTANDGYNNPGNIRAGGDTFAGENTPAGNNFKTFVDVQHGYRAMLHILGTYADSYGLRTFRQMIGRYAPASDNNDVPAYIDAVVSYAKIDADKPLFETYDDNTIKDVIAAMAKREQGNNFLVDDGQINEGFLLA